MCHLNSYIHIQKTGLVQNHWKYELHSYTSANSSLHRKIYNFSLPESTSLSLLLPFLRLQTSFHFSTLKQLMVFANIWESWAVDCSLCALFCFEEKRSLQKFFFPLGRRIYHDEFGTCNRPAFRSKALRTAEPSKINWLQSDFASNIPVTMQVEGWEWTSGIKCLVALKAILYAKNHAGVSKVHISSSLWRGECTKVSLCCWKY